MQEEQFVCALDFSSQRPPSTVYRKIMAPWITGCVFICGLRWSNICIKEKKKKKINFSILASWVCQAIREGNASQISARPVDSDFKSCPHIPCDSSVESPSWFMWSGQAPNHGIQWQRRKTGPRIKQRIKGVICMHQIPFVVFSLNHFPLHWNKKIRPVYSRKFV